MNSLSYADLMLPRRPGVLKTNSFYLAAMVFGKIM